ncbi:hypothetical protein QR685DRAFT_448286, partial [Neurospora intermedia]
EIFNSTNRESYISIASIKTISNYIPIYFIFKTNRTKEFTISNLLNNTQFIKSTTGFSNIEITLD